MANTSATGHDLQYSRPFVSLDKRHHVTHRQQRPDGQWETKCSCGWVSEPGPSREALGWACVPFLLDLYAFAYEAGLRNASCPDEAYNDPNAKEWWGRGKSEYARQKAGAQ